MSDLRDQPKFKKLWVICGAAVAAVLLIAGGAVGALQLTKSDAETKADAGEQIEGLVGEEQVTTIDPPSDLRPMASVDAVLWLKTDETPAKTFQEGDQTVHSQNINSLQMVREKLHNILNDDPLVEESRYISQQEARVETEQYFPDSPEILELLSDEDMPASFTVNLKEADAQQLNDFVTRYTAMSFVDRVSLSEETEEMNVAASTTTVPPTTTAAPTTVLSKTESESSAQDQSSTAEVVVMEVCPVDGASNFRDAWGNAMPQGRKMKGINIFAEKGTPVVAPVGGKVQNATNSLGGSSFRLIASNSDYYFYGSFLDSYAGVLEGSVPNGDFYDVKAGDLLGYVGKSGQAATMPPNLYFEIHKPRYTRIQPIEAIREACPEGKEGK